MTSFAIIYRFHADLHLQSERIRIIRHFNPDTPIYGLYGGNEFDTAEFAFGDCFDHLYHFQNEDSLFKWLHSDLMIKTWFSEIGHSFPFDVLVDHEWDIVLAKPVAELYPSMSADKVALSHLRPMKDIVDKWWWTSGDYRPAYKAYCRYMSAKYGMGMQRYAALGPGAALGRNFLQSFSEEPYPLEIFRDINMEIVISGMPQALGFEVIDNGFHPSSSETFTTVDTGQPSTDWAIPTSPHFHVLDKHLVTLPIMKRCMNRVKGVQHHAFHPVKQQITLEQLLACEAAGACTDWEDRVMIDSFKAPHLASTHSLALNAHAQKEAKKQAEEKAKFQIKVIEMEIPSTIDIEMA